MLVHDTIGELSDCIELGLKTISHEDAIAPLELALTDKSGLALVDYISMRMGNRHNPLPCQESCAKLFLEASLYPQMAEIYQKLDEQNPLIEEFLIDVNQMFLMKYTKSCDTVAFRTQMTKNPGRTFESLSADKIAKSRIIEIEYFDGFGIHALEPDFLQWAGAHWSTKKRWDKIFHYAASITFLKMHPELTELGIKAENEF